MSCKFFPSICSCRGNPPVVAPAAGVGTGALPLQGFTNEIGLL
ncbi:MAG: hypothetical protein WBB29_02370 [Geitlerinemataceae cyanobacterium]